MYRKLTEARIEQLAEFGAIVSRHCRGWADEQLRTSIPVLNVTGGHGGIAEALDLENLGLMGVEDCADLYQYRLPKHGQHAWREVDWERAIREFKGL